MNWTLGVVTALMAVSCQTTTHTAQVPPEETITIVIAAEREAARTALLSAFDASGDEVTPLSARDYVVATLEAAGAEARVFARIEEAGEGVRIRFQGSYTYVSYLKPGRQRTHDLTSTCRGPCSQFWDRMARIAVEVGRTQVKAES